MLYAALRPAHEAGVELAQRTHAALLHGGARLDAHELKHALDSFLSERAEPPQIGPPNASALTTSVPRRNPLSVTTIMRPFTAATISGNASIVERPLSSPRAP